MAEDDEHHHPPPPHRTQASAHIQSATDGSVCHLNVDVSELDGTLNFTGQPACTTTISTIAVQAGEARIVLAILRVSRPRI